ncbi:hypothetical protein FT673_02955 [Aeromonas hydrophila]|nr:hypothetical protein FT673_02955 [Aeromonas hydrophila]
MFLLITLSLLLWQIWRWLQARASRRQTGFIGAEFCQQWRMNGRGKLMFCWRIVKKGGHRAAKEKR